MNEHELKTVVSRKVRDSVGYLSSQITAERQTNLEYYLGEPLGTEIEGRSQVVSRDVMDTVEWMLPPLMSTFHGAENPVEFMPVGPEDEPFAEQATDYVNHVYTVDNPGFMVTYTWLKDALIQKLGVVKSYVETYYDVERHSLGGLTEDDMALLLNDDELEVVGQAERLLKLDDGTSVQVFDVDLQRTVERKKVCVTNVPPEEFVVERHARSLDEARFCAHRTEKTRSELIEMGYDAAVINSLPAYTADDDNADDDNTRYSNEDYDENAPDSADPSTDLIDVTECVIFIDYDDDGVAERRKVVTAGNEHVILENEEFEDPFFRVFCPIPVPHTIWGQAVADQVRDVQLVKSTLIRGMLDDLYQTIDSEKVVNVNKVGDYLEDYLTPKTPGKVYRTEQDGAVQIPLRTWSGAQAFPMLEYYDKIREGRTGVSQSQMGIDKDLLRGTTAEAYSQASTQAQQRVELIARLFAETAFKPLMSDLLRLAVKYQDKERVIRLRNEWVPMDPRSWNAEMDVKINVGLGTGDKSQQMAYLMGILQQQKEAITTPIGQLMVTPGHMFSTLEQMTKVAGFPSVDPFFRDPNSPEAQAEAQQRAQQPDPMQQQMQMMAQMELMKLRLEQWQAVQEDDRKRDEMEADFMIKAAEIQAKHGAQVNVAQIKAMVDREREGMRQGAQMVREAAQPRPQPQQMQPRQAAGGMR